MHNHTLAQLAQQLQQGTCSSEELTRETLRRINEQDEKLNAFITVCEQEALSAAKAADAMRAAGKATALTGIPIAHKDILCTEGVRTTVASRMLSNYVSPYDATCVAQLKAAGAVMVGKTNLDEFAMGSSNENSHFNPCRNPWDPSRVPGGSSGGSAAAVAGRLVVAASGTDTGGSIRQPAALTGVTGLKPTYGRVSRYGLIAFASSLDQAGPLTQTAEDAAMMLQAMAGFDQRDSTSIDQAVPDYCATLNDSLEGVKIGLPKEYFDKIDSRVVETVLTGVEELKKLGASVKEVSLPHTSLAVSAYYVIAPAEASSNLARFDGVRYGHRCDNPKNLEDFYKRSRSEGFGNEVQRRILIGTYVLSAGYYDAYYLKAQKIRRLISQDFQNAFADVDVLLSPTSPTTAFKLGEHAHNPVEMYMTDVNTVAINLAGLPGLSLPAGFIDDLPVGMQLIGNHFTEAKLLNVGHRYQQVSDWHQKLPPTFE
ncbi:MAG: Asp-tRNA(Asn)/Glu-tRNA(Gln) amidotransferase subunit GatA [Gammaproteobacteria bacterium]|nr:Asp-tRNA(Asn)/Glu-tRNA(Gln) amidotransferase subunit GatA [Gammaproteobacteria bacterium]